MHSLSLSLSHTHTHVRAHSLTHSLTHSHTHVKGLTAIDEAIALKEEEGGKKILEYLLSVASSKYLEKNGEALLKRGVKERERGRGKRERGGRGKREREREMNFIFCVNGA